MCTKNWLLQIKKKLSIRWLEEKLIFSQKLHHLEPIRHFDFPKKVSSEKVRDLKYASNAEKLFPRSPLGDVSVEILQAFF
jgi:hypothetical protein